MRSNMRQTYYNSRSNKLQGGRVWGVPAAKQQQSLKPIENLEGVGPGEELQESGVMPQEALTYINLAHHRGF